MYKISVPLMLDNLPNSDKNKILNELKKLDAERVFLAIGPYSVNEEKNQKDFDLLKEYCCFFKQNGLEVGVWLWTFLFSDDVPYMHMTSVKGIADKDEICPSDEDFRKFACEIVKKLIKCGVDLIFYDDDFRYGHLAGGGFCCLCENHLKKISEIVNEDVTLEFMKDKLLNGGPNKYRDAFISANGYYMELFAMEIREAANTVNPNVRIGRCACMSAWDIDGTDPEKIGRLLAGNTQPFVRLIGAPYWAVNKDWGNRLQDVIELERMEKSWITDNNFEVFSEGDVYPRPRWNVPAAFLEGFDTALRADDTTDGILKYAIDYTSSINYETGYTQRHVRNKPLYNEIKNNFSGKQAIGIRVYESSKKYAKTVIPQKIEGTEEIQDCFFSPAARMLSANAIPTVYNGVGICGIVFGENARYLPSDAFKNGLIIDACAARILSEQGIDTGYYRLCKPIHIKEEYYIEENENVSLSALSFVANDNSKLADGVNVLSMFKTDNGQIPACYTYKNKDGQKFLVYNFDAHFNDESLWRNHLRGVQIAKAVKWLSGQTLPAVCHKNPDLYMMVKEKNNELSIGLWNFNIDNIIAPQVILNKSYDKIKFINCSGEMNGNKVTLSEISPYGFAGIIVK